MSIEPTLEETTLEFLYGDGEADPGELVDAAAKAEGFVVWLDRLEGELHALTLAMEAPPARSLALARLRALRAEVVARATPAAAPVISLDAARARRRRATAVVGGLLAIAAGVLIAVVAGRGPDGPSPALRPTVAQAQAWAAELDDGGLAFAGGERPARDRGFLLGLVRDLSAGDGTAAAAPEALELARTLALQALAGVVATDDGEAARLRALAGCATALGASVDAEDLRECERGLSEYAAHRDAALRPAP